MSALAVLNAERIKLTTTRSSLWIVATAGALSLMLAAAQGALASGLASLDPERTTIGVAVFSVPLLMVWASMTMTAEYRSGMIRTTFIAAPNRSLVLVAKALVMSAVSAICAAVLVIGSAATARLLTTQVVAPELELSSPDVWGLVGRVAIYSGLAAVLGVGVGALVRAGPGAVAALLLWPLVVEPLLANMPEVGTQVGPYLPFANLFVFIDVPWLYPVFDMPWGPMGSLGYFVVFVAGILSAAIVVLNLRDA